MPRISFFWKRKIYPVKGIIFPGIRDSYPVLMGFRDFQRFRDSERKSRQSKRGNTCLPTSCIPQLCSIENAVIVVYLGENKSWN